MAEIIRFDPRHIDARLNFRDYLEAARTLPFLKPYGIEWHCDTWDLTGLAKPVRGSVAPVIRFGAYKGCTEPLQGPVAEFARAYVAFKIAESLGAPRQVMKYTGPVLRIRAMQEAMSEAGVSCPTELTPEIFELTCEKIAQASKAKTGLTQLQAQLKWVFDAMREAQILRVPFEWAPPLARSNRAGASRRTRTKADDTRSRPLTTDEVTAIATAFHRAKSPKEQVATSILALLCCVPARIEELLELPADTEVLKHPGQGYRSGIRWWPKKGGAPPSQMDPRRHGGHGKARTCPAQEAHRAGSGACEGCPSVLTA